MASVTKAKSQRAVWPANGGHKWSWMVGIEPLVTFSQQELIKALNLPEAYPPEMR